ncbi:MAG: serine hydrolase domain-containing protein [Armatimonas sp.]
MELKDKLETIRKKSEMPALGFCLIRDGKAEEPLVLGTRKMDGDDPALVTDAFHIGSCTKAMTATLIGQLIEQKKLKYETTLGELYSFTPALWKPVSVAHLLAHRSGIGKRTEPKGLTLNDLHRWKTTDRLKWLRARLATAPSNPTGEKYEYSNGGYLTLGIICETLTRKPWEVLMKERIFQPLGITTAGFGPPPQLYQHRFEDKKFVPYSPTEGYDNPSLIAPAGGCYLTLSDWAKFGLFHLNETPSLRALHAPAFGGDYAGGWVINKGQPWAGGDALTHGGSNVMNYAVIWLAPKKGFGVLAATNMYKEGIEKAMNDVVLEGIRAVF